MKHIAVRTYKLTYKIIVTHYRSLCLIVILILMIRHRIILENAATNPSKHLPATSNHRSKNLKFFPFMQEQLEKNLQVQNSPKIERHTCNLEDYIFYMSTVNTLQTPVFIFFQTHFRTASSILSRLLIKMAEKNKYRFVNGPERFNSDRRSLDHKDHILASVEKHECPSLDEPLLIMDHHSWINFTKEGLPQPNFITFIRNPIEHYISEYYFCRYGTKARPQYRTNDCKTMSMKKLKFTPDQCTREYTKFGENCIQNHDILFFERICGLGRECKINKDYMRGESLDVMNEHEMAVVELTKNRIVANFNFIGIIEYMDLSLLVLEKLAPSFFKGIYNIYSDLDPQNLKIRSGANHKLDLTLLKLESRELLEDIFKYEIDVFKFAENLLFQKLSHLGLLDERRIQRVRFLKDAKMSNSQAQVLTDKPQLYLPGEQPAPEWGFLVDQNGNKVVDPQLINLPPSNQAMNKDILGFLDQAEALVNQIKKQPSPVVDIPQMVMDKQIAFNGTHFKNVGDNNLVSPRGSL